MILKYINKFCKNETLPGRTRNINLNFDFKTKYQVEFEIFSLHLGSFVKLSVSDNHNKLIHNLLDLDDEANIVLGKNAKINYKKKLK